MGIVDYVADGIVVYSCNTGAMLNPWRMGKWMLVAFPHKIVWGSCFYICTPRGPPPPPPALPHCHIQLCHKHTTLSRTNCHTPLCHTHLCHIQIVTHTQLCHTHTLFCHIQFVTDTTVSHTTFVTSNFVTHTTLSPPTLSPTTLSPPTLSHTTWSHTTLSHTTLSRKTLSHPTLSHTYSHTHLGHIQLCHTHNFVTYNIVTPNFVTSNLVTYIFSHTPWSHTTLSHATGSDSPLALGDIHLRFTWQARHLATSTFVSRGRCGTWWHPPSFCVADVALMKLGWVWWHTWGLLVAIDAASLLRGKRGTWWHPPSFQVAGVALGDIHLGFAWQTWHLWEWAGSGDTLAVPLVAIDAAPLLRGRRGTWWHPPSFHVAGVALGDIHLRFAWQAWHLWDWAGSGDTLGAPWSRLTPRHLCVASVALGDIHLRFR